jgi:hypothetical protein
MNCLLPVAAPRSDRRTSRPSADKSPIVVASNTDGEDVGVVEETRRPGLVLEAAAALRV